MLSVAGADHIITMDLHASQIQVWTQCYVNNLVTVTSHETKTQIWCNKQSLKFPPKKSTAIHATEYPNGHMLETDNYCLDSLKGQWGLAISPKMVLYCWKQTSSATHWMGLLYTTPEVCLSIVLCTVCLPLRVSLIYQWTICMLSLPCWNGSESTLLTGNVQWLYRLMQEEPKGLNKELFFVQTEK